jgi:Ca-activated chloride channel family protein
MNHDDPKLTAYALGELDDHDRLAVEAALLRQPELRQAVDEIRSMAALLATELASEPTAALSDSQRRAIEAKSPRPQTATVERPRKQMPRIGRHVAGWLAVAATIAIFAALFLPSIHSSREPASTTELASTALTSSDVTADPHRTDLIEPRIQSKKDRAARSVQGVRAEVT